MERWSGKVAVVTGAASGIGWSICKHLLQVNMVVIGLTKSLKNMDTIREELTKQQRDCFFPHECDVTSLPELRSTFHWLEQRFAQRMHVLINCAGVLEWSKLLDPGNDAALKTIIDVNLMGAVYCTKEAYRLMKKAMTFNEDCHIINVNSLLGHTIPEHIPNCGFNMYPVAKHALRALNDVLRREVSNDRLLRISTISPGFVQDTNLMNKTNRPEHLDNLPEISRPLKPQDVAQGVLFILGLPPHVTISELLMVPTDEKY